MRKKLENGCSKALTVLDLHGKQLHRLLTRITLRHDTAEELLQELFIKLSTSKAFIRADDSAAYACRTAVNLAFDWRKKNKQKTVEFDQTLLPCVDSDPSRLAIEKETLTGVLEAMEKLNETMRFIIVSHYIENVSYEEICRQIGKPENYVRAMCSKAINKLRLLTKDGQYLSRKENVR